MVLRKVFHLDILEFRISAISSHRYFMLLDMICIIFLWLQDFMMIFFSNTVPSICLLSHSYLRTRLIFLLIFLNKLQCKITQQYLKH